LISKHIVMPSFRVVANVAECNSNQAV